MDGKTKDIVAENVGKLKELFPEAFTEGKVDFDALKRVLGEFVDDRDDRYSFTWNGKERARMVAQTPSTGTLRPCKEESVDWDTTQNVFIEGDNLEVLKLLQKSYHKKVKMIYIDPPYNTGNDFVYKDNFKDNIKNYKAITGQVDGKGRNLSNNPETSGRYHTDWLNMMYPRLMLARNLLKDDGVIFISIDDGEIANLRKICDEIFGEENFITAFGWEKKKKPSFLNKNLGTKFEYICAYAKNREETSAFSVELTTEGKKYPFNNAGNSLAILTFPTQSVKFNMTDTTVTPQDMSEGKIKTKLLDELTIVNGTNIEPFKLEGEWRYSQTKLNEIVDAKEEIVISKIPFRPNHIKKGSEIKKMHNLLSIAHYSIPTNEDADAEQVELMGSSYFDYAKPVGLINLLTKAFLYSDEESVVLDFFAGSGTTGHSVISYNQQSKSCHKFLLIQLPEGIDQQDNAYKSGYKTIAEISKERIRRAATKIKEENPDYNGDLGFKVFKLDSTNIKPWEVGSNLMEKTLEDYISNIKPERREEDILYEVILKCGLTLTLPITEHTIAGQKVFDVNRGTLLVCLSDSISPEVAIGIVKLKDEFNLEIECVVFKDSGFKDDEEKTNAFQNLKQAGIPAVTSL